MKKMGFKKGNQFGKQNKGKKRPDMSKKMKGNKLYLKVKNKIRTKATKKKISESSKKRYLNGEIFGFQKGDKNPMRDKKIINKVSIKLKNGFKEGRIVWNKGKPHLVLEKHWNWKGGKSFEPYPISFNKKLKALIKERDYFVCQLCDKTKKILCVHHINYDKKDCRPENLITLCTSCHCKTNYNQNYWENFFNEIKI